MSASPPNQHRILTSSCSKAVDLSTNIVTTIETRAGTGVTRIRQRIQPYASQASESLMKAAETADKYVVDPLFEDYSQGGSHAILSRVLCVCKDVVVGFVAGVSTFRSAADLDDDSSLRPTTKPSDDSSGGEPPLRSYLLSKVDSLFYFPLVITLKSCAASVFATDPRQGDVRSYSYCVGYECGSWIVERCRAVMEWASRNTPCSKVMDTIRKVTALEVSFSGLGECLAQRIPPSVHPILTQMGKLRQMYTCERRNGRGGMRQNHYIPAVENHVKPSDMTTTSTEAFDTDPLGDDEHQG